MYEFAAVALLGLATLKVVDLLSELVPGIAKVRTLTTFALAVATVLALDYSIFSGFGIAVRDAWIGTVVTGLIIGSLAAAWDAVLGWFGTTKEVGSDRGNAGRPRIAA
jgi:hypothetical protein